MSWGRFDCQPQRHRRLAQASRAQEGKRGRAPFALGGTCRLDLICGGSLLMPALAAWFRDPHLR